MESKVRLEVEENPDDYGHIGYEYYPVYFRKGAEDLTKKMNLDILSLNRRNMGMWVKTNNVDYKFPLFKGDKISIHSRFTDVGPIIITMQQIMEKDEKIIAISQTEFYFINLLKTKLTRVPKDITNKFRNQNTVSLNLISD